jgi:ribosomal protein S18 acetylase RimI-like enzyme
MVSRIDACQVTVVQELFHSLLPCGSIAVDIQSGIGAVYVKKTKLLGAVYGWTVGDTFYVAAIAVKPLYRDMKIGSALMDWIKLNCGCSRIELHVQCSNLDAKRFYETHGFSVCATDHGYFKSTRVGSRDAFRMMCSICTTVERTS